MSQNNWNTISPPINVNGSINSSTWNKVRKWLSVLKCSVTAPVPTQKDWRKFEGTCYWKVTSSLPIYNKNTSSTIVYDQGANRQRKFILVLLGASFVLIDLLFTKIDLRVCIWYAWNNTGFIYFKDSRKERIIPAWLISLCFRSPHFCIIWQMVWIMHLDISFWYSYANERLHLRGNICWW